MKKVYFYILGFALFLLLGTGVAFAAYPDFTKTFVVNFPPNQNVTVSNSNPVPVSISGASSMNWEYKMLNIESRTPIESIDEQLNVLGTQGWELVGYASRQTNYVGELVYSYAFKRPIQ